MSQVDIRLFEENYFKLYTVNWFRQLLIILEAILKYLCVFLVEKYASLDRSPTLSCALIVWKPLGRLSYSAIRNHNQIFPSFREKRSPTPDSSRRGNHKHLGPEIWEWWKCQDISCKSGTNQTSDSYPHKPPGYWLWNAKLSCHSFWGVS